MKKFKFRNVIKLSSLYFAATVGAGFASGKEIFVFFTRFQSLSHYGVILSGLLFIIVGYLVMDYIRIYSPTNINDLYSSLFSEKISCFLTFFSSFFLIGVFSIMISGMSNIVSEILCVKYFYSCLIVCLITYIFLVYGIDAIILLSELATPLLISGITLLCIYLLKGNILEVNSSLNSHWSFSAILYISYNIITAVVAFIDARFYIKSRTVAFLSALAGGIALFIASYLINAVLYRYFPIIIFEELPMLKLAESTTLGFYLLWSIILFLAMLTTAVANALGFISAVKPVFKLPQKTIIIFLISISLLLSHIGFTKLIEFFYPLFGYFGMVLILFVFIKYAKK